MVLVPRTYVLVLTLNKCEAESKEPAFKRRVSFVGTSTYLQSYLCLFEAVRQNTPGMGRYGALRQKRYIIGGYMCT